MTSPTQPATADSVKRAVLADAKRQRHIEAGRKVARVQQHEDPPPEVCRKRLAIEIHPPYVAVALQRWADATGKTPVLI